MSSQNTSHGKNVSPIRNKKDLLKGSPANQRARQLALTFLEAALTAVNPHHLVLQVVQLEDTTLRVPDQQINLKDVNGVYVFGAGKAAGRMAEAIEGLVGEFIADGLVIVPENLVEEYSLDTIQVRGGSHPVPTEQSVTASKELLLLLRNSPKNAFVLSLFSGGGSALFSIPTTPLTIHDLAQTTKFLLNSGVPIEGINTVRKHLSDVKGGHYALQVHPRFHWTLLLSDIPGDQLNMIASGPTLPDPTTFQTVTTLCDEYQLWDKLPQRVYEHIEAGNKGTRDDTPKPNHSAFQRVVNQLIGSNKIACEAAKFAAEKQGFSARILTTDCQGEASNVGLRLGSLARQLAQDKKPQVVVVGSETTVTTRYPGKGGRNTELVTAALPFLQNHDGLVLASLATDGIDGPTEYAGAIADQDSYTRANALQLDPKELLSRNSTYTLFQALNDHIFTGSTHTNVRDVTILVTLG